MRPHLRGTSVAAMLLSLLVVGCASFPPAPAPAALVAAPRLEPGESWAYEQIDPYNGQHVRTLTDTLVRTGRGFEIVRRSSRPEDPVQTQTVTAPWAIAAETSVPGNRVLVPPVTFAPPFTRVQFPLRPGIAWHQKLVVHDARGDRYTWFASARAFDWERVGTPAGSFVALRIVLQWNLGDADGSWNDTFVQETLWYAPEVQRWVRRELRYERIERAHIPRVVKDWIVWELSAYRRPG